MVAICDDWSVSKSSGELPAGDGSRIMPRDQPLVLAQVTDVTEVSGDDRSMTRNNRALGIMAQVVNMRWRSVRRDRDVQLRDQGMEYNADRAWVHRSAAYEREYRRVGRCAGHLYRSSVHEGVEACGQARPPWDEPGFGEFCLADDQDIPVAVDGSPTQSSNLPDAKAEAEEQGSRSTFAPVTASARTRPQSRPVLISRLLGSAPHLPSRRRPI